MSTQPQPASLGDLAWTVGDRLRKAREYAGLTQKELGEQVGITRNTVGNYETGATQSRHVLIMRAWADTCGVPLSWIEGDEPSGGPGGIVLPFVGPDGGGHDSAASLRDTELMQYRSSRERAPLKRVA